MNNKQLPDDTDRKAIKTCLDQTFLVEAGAGSGKTSCLVDRMIALLSEGYCKPETLAAITFTRKAAGELKERFQVGLEKHYLEEKDIEVRLRLGEALEKIERCFIGTIHSFCSRLLRERPVEAGITPNFTAVEGLEERLLEEAAWEKYLLEVGAGDPGHLEMLDKLDLSPADLKDAFRELNLYPEVEIKTVKVPAPQLGEARSGLERFCRRAKKILPQDEPQNGWDSLQSVARLALRWQRVFDLGNDLYMQRLLAKMDRQAKATYNRWPDKNEAGDLEADFDSFREKVLKPARKAWLEHRHYHLVKFLRPAVEHYRETRRRENLLNFQDLLMLSAQLLKSNLEVRDHFQQRYTHLLVDEFQDTDPIQAEIMFYLTGENLNEQDWTMLNPKPGSLFVVGDPKQSIYRFRRADITTYDLVKCLIKNSGGEVLHLSSNFRSVPELIMWGNSAFGSLFKPLDLPYQVNFTPMADVRENKAGCEGGVLTLAVPAVKYNSQEAIVGIDADNIAKWISQALNGGFALSRTTDEEAFGLNEHPVAGDFLIIVHFKKHMNLYARALEANGIPFTLTGSGDLAESEELHELLNLLQSLSDPDNPVPLVATLRGTFFGISDDLLYRFKKAGGQFSFLQDVPENAEQEVADQFIPAWERFKCFWNWTRELPPSSAIEKITGALGIIPLALAKELGKSSAGNIMQALELLRNREQQGETVFPQAVDYLERLLEEGAEEELDIEGGGASAVRIINLHKAKGLEAPVVILANPGKTVTHEPTLHVKREDNQAHGYLAIGVRKNDYSFQAETLAIPPLWDKYRLEEEKYQAAERTRLLYVAATRARNLLVISIYPKKPECSPWCALEQYLDEENCRDAFSIIDHVDSPVLAGAEKGGLETITGKMLEESREKIAAGLEQVIAPTYQHQSGTELRSEENAPRRKSKGKGTDWGNLIHAALEQIARKAAMVGGSAADADDFKALADMFITKESHPFELKSALIEALKQITSFPLWQRIFAAKEVLPEVSFGVWEGDIYKTGIVDLAFRERGGWVLIDYKTDVVEDLDHQKALVAYYKPQVEFYRQSWEQITGETVIECGLFFTDNLYYYPLPR